MCRVLVLAYALSFVSNVATARTWYIRPDGSGDAPTVQAGMDSAQASDVVLLAPGSYTWTSQQASGHSMVQLKAGVTLRGEHGAANTVLDAEGQRRVLLCWDTGGAVHIEGLTIQRGLAWWTEGQPFTLYYGGGILSTGASSPTITDCIFRSNSTGIDNSGGAICLENGGVVSRCTFVENGCIGSGGAISARDATISNCTFIRNSVGGHGCGDGGAIVATRCTISDSWFEDNRSSGAHCFGGPTALSVNGPGSTVIVRCMFRRHTGGTCVQSGSECHVEACSFVDNGVQHGLIDQLSGAPPVEISSCSMVGNRVVGVAGEALLIDGSANIRECLFAFNVGSPCSDQHQVRCSNFFGNGTEDAGCAGAGADNFSADPEFCAVDPATSLNLMLQSDSPCAPGNHPNGASCGLIGAGPVGCGTVSVRRRTWSDVKSFYR